MAYINPELVNLRILCFIGDFAYFLGTDYYIQEKLIILKEKLNSGTEYPLVLLLINVFAWIAHCLEAVCALWLCDDLLLTHRDILLTRYI